MIEIVLGLIAIAGLGTSVALALRVRQLDERLRSTERAIESVSQKNPLLTASEATSTRSLEGLRVALSIAQDHAHSIFANMLKEQLLREDVTEVDILNPAEAESLQADWKEQGPDILISGQLTCNGYAEIYFDADFTCQTPHEPICTLIERPPHGDRPGNLVVELVAKLKTELERMLNRQERRLAIRELRDQ